MEKRIRFFVGHGIGTDFDKYMDSSVLSQYKGHISITKGEDYTHAILINICMPDLPIPKENVIGLAYEPNPILFASCKDIQTWFHYVQKHVGKYILGDKEKLLDPFIEGQSFLTYNRVESIPQGLITKTKFCSIIVSSKRFMPGHYYRHQLIQAILQTGLPIDIYGAGGQMYARGDKRVKGPFPADHGTVPYLDYRYSICIENMISNYYFSEKIINPLLYNTIPIYLGCRNIDEYLPTHIKMVGDINKDMELLHTIFMNPEKYDIEIDRSHVLKTVNMFHHLDKLFDDIELGPADRKDTNWGSEES
jgi:Glycosyltransferase family 10 (fucosyltransferase) C-term